MLVRLVAEILHCASPVQIREQPRIYQAHSLQRLGGADVENLLIRRAAPQVVNRVEHSDKAQHCQYENGRSDHVHPAGSAHFRFRRWKINTAPEMAIAE